MEFIGLMCDKASHFIVKCDKVTLFAVISIHHISELFICNTLFYSMLW